MKHPWAIFLGGFVLAFGVLTGLFFGYMVVNRQHLPALHYSSNKSLNEKVRWLQTRLANPSCDTLVIGSSMALNGIDYRELEATGFKQVTNAGAWSLGVPQTLSLLKIILTKCKPTIIIYPVYYGDFDFADAGTDIDFDRIAAYMARASQGDALINYIAEFNPYDLIHDMKEARKREAKGNTIYETLRFDASGAALFSATNFETQETRWDGYRYSPIRTKEGSYRAFAELADLARGQNIRLVVAEPPLRAQSIPVLGPDNLAQWQNSVRQICTQHGGTIVDMPEPGEFGDELFADFAHLNENGARLWTRRIAKEIHP
ncbi:SGNH/GDSL hydrolase family protein [Oryzibacter oryziterrae]|uniref:SGNH/GDSL hydrolase family protein n=1 Tax=Oryzibacter oryziterrae TaxID=2766474 RepID=UPI001F361DC3|nr:hypothetical protein [Oryzibacter oryziterrae]